MEPIPPIAKLKIRLSISKPVFAAKLNNDGGFQYSGTNNGSVKPNGIVNKLTQNISFLVLLLRKKMASQIKNKIKENTNHSLNTTILSYSFKELYIFANSHPIIHPKTAVSITPSKPYPKDIVLVMLLISIP